MFSESERNFDRMMIGTLYGCRWGELESGQTTIAFTPIHQHETDELTGKVLVPESSGKRSQLEVCFDYQDVDAAYKVSYQSNFKIMEIRNFSLKIDDFFSTSDSLVTREHWRTELCR